VSGRDARHDSARERIAAAVVELVAGRDLAAIGVEEVCKRAGVGRGHFDRCFAGIEDCLLSVYDEVVDELCARVMPAYEGPASWHDRIWAVGWAAVRFLREDAVRARFFVAAVNGTGGRAQARRDRVMQRLADLLDAGREGLEDRPLTSRCTAEVAAGAIYSTVLTRIEAGAIDRGEDFLPELIYMATMPYLGSRAAEEELLVQPLRAL
jgi:AcrR family transcriptional regulator